MISIITPHTTWRMIVAAATAVATLSTAQAAAPSHDAGLIELSPAQVAGLRIQFVAAVDANEYLLASLPATIAPPPNARVAVAATFPGVVLQTLVVEGDAVKRGQPLATIASREILTLGADLAQARAQFSVAEANAERQNVLSKEGIVAAARAEEAEATLRAARAELNEKTRMAAAVNADGAKGTYTLTAPIDGIVASSNLETGAPVDGMSAAFVVDALNRYEVTAQVPERLIALVSPGMRVAIDGKIEARVTSVGKVVQPATRSAALKASIVGSPALVAGRTAMASIYAEAPAGAVRIPRTALADIGGTATVFVRAAGGVSARSVHVAPVTGDQAVVLSGLKTGEEVASSNLSELKSLALAK